MKPWKLLKINLCDKINLTMTQQKILNSFQKFRKLSGKSRRRFLSAFEKKMLLRTTKTENPETTFQMVQRVLTRLQFSS
ncbi:hypothetical protein A3E73_01825 [Candidatus Beckwithbacteria bacterium RIFCSPHIGHO2_12_FULL_47_17]|uniref:Uncharacterized protein n=1 Tax=Candidatus Beckwithbacteria bacterium RIFCSPHIGHO2_12_FULL_47_17 TaxID=1797460 RepID=A0A1F5DPG4_9BACT|nr:MAG: hypothetical protein A3E73_01825 [Candidatus Beckwithbacteria bacterium RIFCSPHIGHO2_12_FULL_47_17]